MTLKINIFESFFTKILDKFDFQDYICKVL